MYTAPDEQYYYPSKVCVKHHVLSNNFSVGSESPALLAAQTAQGFTGGHDRNAFDLSECEQGFEPQRSSPWHADRRESSYSDGRRRRNGLR